MISQLALFFFLLLFCATNGLSHGLQVSGSKEVLGRHLHIVLGDVRLAQYETGSRTPKADLTAALAQVLDVSPHALSVPAISGYTSGKKVADESEEAFMEHNIHPQQPSKKKGRVEAPLLGLLALAVPVSVAVDRPPGICLFLLIDCHD